jgi:hypothetical protein
MTPARTVLAAALCVAALVPATAAGADGDPPPVETTPPTEPAPPPETTPPDVVTLEPEPPPRTITINVPAIPEPPKPKAQPAKPVTRVVAEPRRKRVRASRVSRASRRDEPVVESSSEEAEKQPVKPARAKPRPRKRPVAVPRRPVTTHAPVVAPQPHDSRLKAGVLAAEYSLPSGSDSGTGSFAYVLLSIGTLAGFLLALAGSAPALASAWPRAFVPVIKERERLFLIGLCIACGAFAWAITWVLAGSGA